MTNPLGQLNLESEHACFGGVQRFYKHVSSTIGLPMSFSVFLPAAAKQQPVPALLYLAGLTCTHETFAIKAGAQRWAAAAGLALIAPDTSPRGAHIEGEGASWDFGLAASFYLDATQAPWAQHYRMESYVTRELLALVGANLPIDTQRLGITGHSMGGHGALTLALRHPGLFKSVSAFAPICAPSQCPWGQKAFFGYFGDDVESWQAHDAVVVMRAMAISKSAVPYPSGMLIDQGLADQFLATQLYPHLFEAACAQAGQPLNVRRHAGYDHGYYFVASFMADHIEHHRQALCG